MLIVSKSLCSVSKLFRRSPLPDPSQRGHRQRPEWKYQSPRTPNSKLDSRSDYVLSSSLAACGVCPQRRRRLTMSSARVTVGESSRRSADYACSTRDSKGVLPHGWRYITNNGRSFYHHVETDVSTWKRPTDATPPEQVRYALGSCTSRTAACATVHPPSAQWYHVHTALTLFSVHRAHRTRYRLVGSR